MDGIVDAVQCFHRMADEWTVNTVTQDDAEWVPGRQSNIVLMLFTNIPFRFQNSLLWKAGTFGR